MKISNIILPVAVVITAATDYVSEDILHLSGYPKLLLAALIAFVSFVIQEFVNWISNKPYEHHFKKSDFDNGEVKILYKKHKKKHPTFDVFNQSGTNITGVGKEVVGNDIKIVVEPGYGFDGYVIIK